MKPVATAIAIAFGLIVLLGYFLPLPPLPALRDTFVGWAVILAAIATLIGVINLLAVHTNKISLQQPGNGYSLILIAAFILTLILGLWEILTSPAAPLTRQVVNSIQFPVEASLMGVLAASLAFASIRLLRRRRSLFAILFFVATLVFLVAGSGLFGILNLPGADYLQTALDRLPVFGGRGLLLGVALGSLLTGLRVLVGADRPYGG